MLTWKIGKISALIERDESQHHTWILIADTLSSCIHDTDFLEQKKKLFFLTNAATSFEKWW